MKTWGWVMMTAMPLLAADSSLERMSDARLTVSQRNSACFEVRGQNTPEVRASMAKALQLDLLRACAAENLRAAGAIDELRQALADENPEIRATAARSLGSFGKPELLEPLAKAASDPNLLVATNGVYALSQYQDAVVFPYLEPVARKGGIVGIMALNRIFDLHDPEALAIARKLLSSSDVPDRVSGMRVIGAMGGKEDLPTLREIASKPSPVMVRQRGFGLMPSIDLARAAKATIAQIETRQGEHAQANTR
jgi:HEAT repeat protein